MDVRFNASLEGLEQLATQQGSGSSGAIGGEDGSGSSRSSSADSDACQDSSSDCSSGSSSGSSSLCGRTSRASSSSRGHAAGIMETGRSCDWASHEGGKNAECLIHLVAQCLSSGSRSSPAWEWGRSSRAAAGGGNYSGRQGQQVQQPPSAKTIPNLASYHLNGGGDTFGRGCCCPCPWPAAHASPPPPPPPLPPPPPAGAPAAQQQHLPRTPAL